MEANFKISTKLISEKVDEDNETEAERKKLLNENNIKHKIIMC